MNNIALVTTCLNEGDSIHLWLEDVEAQTVYPDEIIIIDAGSRDNTLSDLRQWRLPACRVHVEEVRGCSVAQGRNRAIALAQSDIIVSTDTGCRLACDWIEKMTTPFQSGGEAPDVVAGNYTADPSTLSSAVSWADFYLKNRFQNDLRFGFFPSSRSIAYRRRVWELLGGYPEDLRYAGDDTVFAHQIYRHKLITVFAPRALVYWRRHHEMRKYLKEAFNYGRGNGEAGLRMGPICTVATNASKLRVKTACVWRALDRFLLKSILTAVGQGHLGAAIMIPWLRLAVVYHFNLGYRDGLNYGDIHCSSCRARLSDLGSNGEKGLLHEG